MGKKREPVFSVKEVAVMGTALAIAGGMLWLGLWALSTGSIL